MLILLAALTLGALGALKSMGVGLGDKAECAAEAIETLTPGAVRCAAASPGEASPEAGGPLPQSSAAEPGALAIDGPDGPALEGSGPINTLPFPGSVAVSCTALKGQKDACKDQTGVRVQTSGEVSIERSPTRLDATGCARQDLSVSAKLQVELSGKAKGKTVGGTLTAFTGNASKFKVTVSPDQADAIARGDRSSPNPIDPTTLLTGESLELSEEFFTGHKLQGTYRALQAELGFEAGRRLSSGVKRVDPNTLRIFVGDSDFVRQALSVGVSAGEFGISIGGKEELASGNLRAVDLDISTPEGFEAYQRFLAEGRLPGLGAPGVADPTVAETLDFSDTTKIEAKLGRLKLGGVLGDSEGHLTETRHADGTVDTAVNARFNSVGLAFKERLGPDSAVEKSFSLLLEGVDGRRIGDFEHFTGQSLFASPGGNVRLDFTESDLRSLQAQALDQVAQRAKDTRVKMSREDLERRLREDPRSLQNTSVNDGFDLAFEIATAKSPEDVLHFLYLFGGTSGDANRAMDNLLSFSMKTARARHGSREIPKDHSDSLLPGKGVAPSCG